MKQLTLNRLKKTNFENLYKKLTINEGLNNNELTQILTLAIIFLNSKSADLQHLGYRIIVFYSNLTKNYRPLYDISINSGLIPINKIIENLTENQLAFDTSFFKAFFSSYIENFKQDNIYFSEGQLNLFDSFEKYSNETVSVIAPTSYGKSELIISYLKNIKDKNICILVPTKSLLAQTRSRILKANIKNISKIITHPEMYMLQDKNITAVLTQERLLRLFKKSPNLFFDVIFIDEAHNLLENDARSILLASTLAILEKRNPCALFKFLTPFLEDSSNLMVRHTNYKSSNFLKINEYIKTEKLFIYDFKRDCKLKLYDQFLDRACLRF